MAMEVAKKSIAIGGTIDEQVEFMSLGDVLRETYDGYYIRERFDPQYYRNVTYEIWLAERYKWIRDKCLYGQDNNYNHYNEFNIYRSLCFAYYEEWIAIKLSIGILSILLQLMLTIGICIEVDDNWDNQQMFGDGLIVFASLIIVAFISYTYIFTVDLYFEFYGNMKYVTEISWLIWGLDFVSNIVIGFIICVISWFYLLQSDDIGDVILNSFALAVIIKLDDIVNVFDADEILLLNHDWYHLSDARTGYSGEFSHFRRYTQFNWKTILKSLGYVFISPLFIVWAVVKGIRAQIQFYKDQNEIMESFVNIKKNYGLQHVVETNTVNEN